MTFLAACGHPPISEGNAIKAQQLEQIILNQSNRTDVIRALGTPSAVATFSDNVWIYFSRQIQPRTIYEPEVTSLQSILVKFNNNDIVENLEIYDKDDSRNIKFATQKTPTSGYQPNVIEQLLGNIGRNTDVNQ